MFIRFKRVFEKYFQKPIISFCFDNEGEFVKVKTFFQAHGISYFFTTPHTPQRNGYVEWCHKQIQETGVSLQAKGHLPSSFLMYAFTTVVFLPNLYLRCNLQIIFLPLKNYFIELLIIHLSNLFVIFVIHGSKLMPNLNLT